MKIMLVGGHNKLNFLIKSLKPKGHNITIVNDNYEWCKILSDTHEVISVHGDGSKAFILEDAGAHEMDIVIALGVKDSVNLVICQLAKKQFNVQTTMAVVNNPKNLEIFKKLGVDKCISPTKMLVEAIEQQALLKDIKSYISIENGKIGVFEVEISKNFYALNKKLKDIPFPKESIVGFIIRDGKNMIPKGDTQLALGDKIVILSYSDFMESVVKILSGGNK